MFDNDLPRTVHIVSQPAGRFDLQLDLSQVELNVPLGPEAFRLRRRPHANRSARSALKNCGDPGRSARSTMRDGSLTVHAFAKINLDLRVLGLRPDGYHELRTTFQSIALADTLTFTRVARAVSASSATIPACPSDHTNLIWKAAQRVLALARRREQPSGVHVRVEKNIPMQAGLGGGSSNAAAALHALCRLWKVKTTPRGAAARGGEARRRRPVFLEGGTALGFHRGDVLVPLDDIDPAWVVVVVPDFGVSTKDAFAWWDRARKKRQDGSEGRARLDRRARDVSNDLQPFVAKRHPIVGRLVRALIRKAPSTRRCRAADRPFLACSRAGPAPRRRPADSPALARFVTPHADPSRVSRDLPPSESVGYT